MAMSWPDLEREFLILRGRAQHGVSKDEGHSSQDLNLSRCAAYPALLRMRDEGFVPNAVFRYSPC
jgi:hypothetical protein